MQSARLSDLIRSLKMKGGETINVQELRIRYALERFLMRLSQSDFRDNFVLKGGFLMGTIYNIGQRTTKDLDTVVKNLPAEQEEIGKALHTISTIDLNDGVTFVVSEITQTQEQRRYPGFRAKMIMLFDGEQSRVNFDLDIGVGDVITPSASNMELKLTFSEIRGENESIRILAYPIQTILAEKLETVLEKGIQNSRMKDFYDLRLMLSDPNRPKIDLCYTAFENTWLFRHGSIIDEDLFEDWLFVIEELGNNQTANQVYWPNYAKDRKYAQGIAFEQIARQIKGFILELQQFYNQFENG
ncbi:nucleotidyltransferase AbiEii toxin of type IV toxin-antitoxin system [Trichococcus patagoniensis]|uniref:Nucleotidyltransferase AbiEii toxin of type IV toxin-antitoxin system n=1 Tax=Trichococcus patagoniensis TaxID=382641 RepID=A0A2T5IQ69_9LACT|nr:nucleotidyl transferase AbiEii/AbiGii toxin family protein [Trichococcus patagoniensis]PTQ85972.1 nucleotidyltransferase AbiEii toxin of type IV toxin-antitoxin system [Trichococcus patagoniensis]